MYTFRHPDPAEWDVLLPQISALHAPGARKDIPDPQGEAQALLLMQAQELPVGCIQYSLRGDAVQLERIALDDTQEHPLLLYHALRHLLAQLPPEILYLEDYVDKQRTHAIQVNEKLGMTIVGENTDGTHLLMRASLDSVRRTLN